MKNLIEKFKKQNKFLIVIEILFVLFGLAWLWKPLIYVFIGIFVAAVIYFIYKVTIKKKVETSAPQNSPEDPGLPEPPDPL